MLHPCLIFAPPLLLSLLFMRGSAYYTCYSHATPLCSLLWYARCKGARGKMVKNFQRLKVGVPCYFAHCLTVLLVHARCLVSAPRLCVLYLPCTLILFLSMRALCCVVHEAGGRYITLERFKSAALSMKSAM